MPDFSLEQSISGNVCGLDEVGRGPLAGPVVAACVYVPEEAYALPFVSEIKDSKKLSKTKLAELYALITEHFTHAICEVSPQEIDQINILQASLLAMKNAYTQVSCTALHHALVDGRQIPKGLPCGATPVIKGDNISTSIAAASVIAKVHRDRTMKKLAEAHPHYGWESNAGYPSPQHLAAIDVHGITEHHRKSFAPVKNFLEFGSVQKRA